MKKLIIPALILALILSGCSFTEQLETVKTEYIDPGGRSGRKMANPPGQTPSPRSARPTS